MFSSLIKCFPVAPKYKILTTNEKIRTAKIIPVTFALLYFFIIAELLLLMLLHHFDKYIL